MNALDTLDKIVSNEYLVKADLKYCFHKEKVPYNGLSLAKPNNLSDFLSLYNLDISIADKFDGLGISIQASNVSAIDVDHCVKEPFDIHTLNDIGKKIIEIFKNYYIEFSYSGTGLRVLFYSDEIQNYNSFYLTKNSKTHCEYYTPKGSARYVTITGRNITNNDIKKVDNNTLFLFLNSYMLKEKPINTTKTIDMNRIDNVDDKIIHLLRTDLQFLDNWCEKAPGSGKNESERDWYLLNFIYNNITKNKNQVKEIFESSPFFKSKDWKHIKKWNRNDYRYFNYLWDCILGDTEK